MSNLVVGIDMGHSLSGAGTGAVGICREIDKNREVGNRLIAMLEEKGYTVVNCTVDYADSVSSQLRGITNKANAQSLDMFVSLHLNSFNGQAHGVEVYVYPNCDKSVAQRVLDNLVSQVGWYNRGVKEADFHVLRETVAPAILCELGFCDNSEDMNSWDTEKIAKAIFEGVTNTEYTAPAPAPAPAPSSGDTMFRVVCGTYANRENAVAQQERLKSAGFDSFLVAYNK